MIEAKRAAVRPRVFLEQDCAPLLLEGEIRSFMESGAQGVIAILGQTGSGKTTALEHLAATLPPACNIALLDEPKQFQLEQAARSPDGLVIYTAQSERLSEHLATYQLALWEQDDLIEYLLTVHRPQCASVMTRIQRFDNVLLGGLPELWRIVLDRLAADPSIPSVRHALHRHLEEHLTDTDLLERARSACLNLLVTPNLSLSDVLLGIAKTGFVANLIRLLRHPAMLLLLASERIAADLHGESACDYLAKRLSRGLVVAAGRLVAEDDRALEHLHRLLDGPSWSHAMAVSLLHAAGRSADLRNRSFAKLAGAYLSQVCWPDIQLPRVADLRKADLTEADLRGAKLERVVANRCCLQGACLKGACLNQFFADGADLSDADLRCVCGELAVFAFANLKQANLSHSHLLNAAFTESNLTAADFRDTVLRHANFTGCNLRDADFSGADLTGANLSGLCLREAHWEGVRFTEANLANCDLEYMMLLAAEFEQANLRGALLTGSTMPGANFRGAWLCNAGLADIEWEGADLSGADLRGASFHMGSTRSGLVGSPIPCEGSKTGFYTDDYDEQTYKAPEEIRKANLCNVDLRGAILDGVDFYLVDLRGALYDAEQEDHLRRCGAILETRVEGND